MKRLTRIALFLGVLACLLASCKKGHYDIGNVHGVNAEGEVLLPVASKTFTIMDLMERLELMDEIDWSQAGDMKYCFEVENYGVVNGAELLKFKDVEYEESYVFENHYQAVPPPFADTIVRMERSIVFESDHVRVRRAKMKSGRLDFTIASNFGNVRRVVLRSDNIIDEAGNEAIELDLPVHANTFGLDLEGLRYYSNTDNTLNLDCELYVSVHGTTNPEISIDLNIKGSDLAFSEMQGFVESYSCRSSIDSVFTFTSENLSGTLEMEGVRIKVSERNSFGLDARLVVDTALVFSEGLPPYSILEPLPLIVDLPPQLGFREVFNKEVSGQINAKGGRAYASSNFIVNPQALTGLVMVFDTNRIDTRVSVEIPFSFAVDNIAYLDTVDVDLANLELPDMIEQLTLELTLNSTLPLNMKGSFFMYDSGNEMITDTLLLNADIVKTSFDGKPVKTNVTLVVDEERKERVMQSDRIIMLYTLDTGAHGVDLNANQKLDFYLKARVKYNADVEFNETD